MAGITNRGKFLLLQGYFRGTLPTNLYVALVTSATAPTADTNTLSELTEVTAGNGYTSGGVSLSRNSTDFDVLTETDASDIALVQAKNIVWTASGGNLPSAGAARYAVLTTDEGTVGSRQIIAFWDLGSDRVVSDTQTLTLQDAEVRLTE